MKRWKDCPAFLSPKGILRSLYSTKGGDDRRLGDVLWSNWHLVVPLVEIQLAENLLANQLGQEVLHVGRWVHVPLGDQVQPPVVTTGPPGASGLLHYVQRC